MRHRQRSTLAAGTLLIATGLLAGAVGGPVSGGFDLSWRTIDGGGGTSTGGDFVVRGTIGQPDAGPAMAGGDFTLVGGFWAGAPEDAAAVPAELVDVAVVYGTHLSGGLPELLDSDNAYYRARSRPGLSAFEPNVADVLIGAINGHASPATLDVSIESRINNPGGTAKIRFRNWSTNQFNQIGAYAIGFPEEVVVIEGTPAADFVRASDDRVELSVRHVVVATLSALGFDSSLDRVAITAE